LLVYLRSQPTERHYDPEEVQLALATPTGRGIAQTTIYHPWPHQDRYHAAAGPILLLDRKGKREDAYTFGGELQVKTEEQLTRFQLRSEAPIIHPITPMTIPMMLTKEAEILFSQRRADWLPRQEAYERRLASLDPRSLYASFLVSLERRLHALPDREDLSAGELLEFVEMELEVLKSKHRVSEPIPPLSEIL
jgi:hypothetical protein